MTKKIKKIIVFIVFLLLMGLIFFSCNNDITNYIGINEFIVVKVERNGDSSSIYYFKTDYNDKIFNFVGFKDRFTVGDTIKFTLKE